MTKVKTKVVCSLCGYEFKEVEHQEQYCSECYTLIGCLHKLNYRCPNGKTKVLNELGLIEKEGMEEAAAILWSALSDVLMRFFKTDQYPDNKNDVKKIISEVLDIIQQIHFGERKTDKNETTD